MFFLFIDSKCFTLPDTRIHACSPPAVCTGIASGRCFRTASRARPPYTLCQRPGFDLLSPKISPFRIAHSRCLSRFVQLFDFHILTPYQLLPKSYHSRRWVGVGREKGLRDSGLGRSGGVAEVADEEGTGAAADAAAPAPMWLFFSF